MDDAGVAFLFIFIEGPLVDHRKDDYRRSAYSSSRIGIEHH